MRQKLKITLHLCISLSLLLLAGIACGDQEYSDIEKKETVYRMYAGYKKDFPNVKDLSPQQALELMNITLVKAL